ncbi:heat shock protein ClpB [Candidatus Protochlamydia naegleriophila]|uniref:Heat shock protein ClpB n=1 Tax=Candidatus Protochlamydia naegleriophila TaxID=389348 RepID=A0A0U5JDE5_9BACT|nr:hypothetical protein [Candidatus Protochlamydia naegleriophila]CUI16642.1 heat shock protein ClpB [Candidatus Protochlamydia naegleriophila]
MLVNAMRPYIPFFHQQAVEPASPLNAIRQLDELGRLLLSEEWDVKQWTVWKADIQSIIRQHQGDHEALDRFLSEVITGMIAKDPQEALTFLADILDLESLSQVARFKAQADGFPPFENIFEWAALRAPLFPISPEISFKQQVHSEWNRFRPMAIYFIPNLINIFLGAFNFLDSHKKFTTLWEKHLLLEIVYKFFVIPFFLIQVLQPIFVVTAKVYAIAAGIIVCGGVLAACYQKWLKPLPDEIVNCTNLDKQMELGFIEPTVGMSATMDRIISALLTGSNVLLLGRSGAGKSAAGKRLIQLKKEGRLPQALQKLANYEVDCGLLMSNVSFGHSELINQVKDQLAGYEHQVLFHLDEIDQLVKNGGAFQAFKKRFLEDRPSPAFIATTTFKEFEKIKELDDDGSFRRRVVPIVVDDADETQNRLILSELVNRVAAKIPVTDDAIDKVLELTESEEYLPQIGRPAKAIKLMKDAIGRCEWTYNSHFVCPELEQARQAVQNFESHLSRNIKETSADLREYAALRERVRVLESEHLIHKQKIQKIRLLIEQELVFKNRYYKLTHRMANARPNLAQERRVARVTGEEQKLYLLTYFYGIGAYKSYLQEKLDEVKESFHVQVDEALISKVFDEAKQVDERIAEKVDGRAANEPAEPVHAIAAEVETEVDNVVLGENEPRLGDE